MKTVSRNEAKSNLHVIRENNARRKIENVLFDRFWYQNREEKQRRERMKKRKIVEEMLRRAKIQEEMMLRNSSMMHEKANRSEYTLLMRTKVGRQVMRALMEKVKHLQNSESDVD